MQLKFYIIAGLLVLNVFNPLTLNAQVEDTTIRNQQQRVSYFQNLSGFFGTFFDLDNSFRFLKDDMFIGNQCIRRDVFALHSAKTQVSDYMLDNYLTITESELEVQKRLYQSYSDELVFLRNLELLVDSETQLYDLNKKNTLREAVLAEAPGATLYFDAWFNRYQNSFEEYQKCDTSFSSVFKKVKSIKSSYEKLDQQSTDLESSLNNLIETIKETPDLFVMNAENNLSYSVLNSYYSTRDNFLKAGSKAINEFSVFSKFPESLIRSSKQEQERVAGSAASLKQSIASSNSLTELPAILDQMNQSNIQREQYVLTQTTVAIQNTFSDTANLVFMNYLNDINAELTVINNQITADTSGLLPLVESVENKQCNA